MNNEGGSKLLVELYYHEVRNYVVKSGFEQDEEYLDEAIDIGHEEDYDYHVLENIFLSCSHCDYDHMIEVGLAYDTIYAIYDGAETIIEKELSNS